MSRYQLLHNNIVLSNTHISFPFFFFFFTTAKGVDSEGVVHVQGKFGIYLINFRSNLP